MKDNNKNKTNVPNLRFPGFEGEWNERKLGEITRWSSGGTPPKDSTSYWNGNIPWISASSMRGLEYSDSELKITDEGLKKGSKLAKKGMLLILVRGSMLFNKIPIGIAIKDVAFNQDVKSIEVNRDLTSYYLLYWMISNEPSIMNMVTGTGIGAGKLDLQDLKALEINLPSLLEQTKIASFFVLIDERIEYQSKIIEGLKSFKSAVSKKIFSQELRFKDENGEEFEDWKFVQTKDIFQITRGNVLSMLLVSKEKTNEYQYPVFSSQTQNRGLAGFYSRYLFEDAITWTTDGAGAGDVNYRSGKFYCTNVCGVLLSKEGYANQFVAEILNNISRKYVSYVGNPKLMNNVMAEIPIQIPTSIEEQQEISSFLSTIDKKISLETSLLLQLKLQKQYLLQQMFI